MMDEYNFRREMKEDMTDIFRTLLLAFVEAIFISFLVSLLLIAFIPIAGRFWVENQEVMKAMCEELDK